MLVVVDARTRGHYTWSIEDQDEQVRIVVEGSPFVRVVGYLWSAEGRVVARTPWRTDVVDERSRALIIADLVRAARTLTRFDLVPGRHFRVVAPFRALGKGTELELLTVDEHKPSGRDIYSFRSDGGLTEISDAEDGGGAALLDGIARHLAVIEPRRSSTPETNVRRRRQLQMGTLVYRAAPRQDRRLSKKDVDLGRKALGFGRFDVVHRTKKGRWIGIHFANGRRELVTAGPGTKRSVVAVPGQLTERCDAHPSLERALVVAAPDWNKVMATTVFELDLETGKLQAVGYHPKAVKAIYCGDTHVAVVSPVGVTRYRRDADRLVLDGFAGVGGLDVACVRNGKALLVLTRGGWVLVEIHTHALVPLPGKLRAPDNVVVFERDGMVLEDEDEGALREIVLPARKELTVNLDKHLDSLVVPRPVTKLRLRRVEPSEIPKAGKAAAAPKLKDVAVDAIAAIDASSVAYVSEKSLRIRNGKTESERVGLDAYDVAVFRSMRKPVVLSIDLLRESVEKLPGLPGAAMTRLTVVDPVRAQDVDRWELPGYGWRLSTRDGRAFVHRETLAFEVVATA